MSGGALSVSNQTSSLNHATNRPFTTNTNLRLEENSMTRNVSSTNTSNARFNTEFEPIEPSPARSTRLSLVSQLHYDELKRKKDFENMLDIHIDSLRKTNSSEHANNFI